MLISKPHRDWIEGVFLPAELAELERSRGPKYSTTLAGNYAAKEAVAKALGTGFSGDVCWTDVEITRNEKGAPQVRLVAGALDRATMLNIKVWHLTISHSANYAIASAIAESLTGDL